MLSGKQKLRVVAGLATLFLFAAGVGCSGFFVDPTLTGISVSPSSVSLQSVGATQQLTATGTYNDGSTKNLTSAAGTTWNSSDSAVVSVNSTGLIKVVTVNNTTVNVTASNGGFTSPNVTVTVGSSSGGTITVACTNCSNNTISVSGSGGVAEFTATQSGSDVTTQATWSSSNSSVVNIPSTATSSPIQGTLGSVTSNTSVTITATANGGTGNLTITVTP